MYVFIFYFGGGDIMSAKIKNMVVEVPFVNNNMKLRTTDGTRVFAFDAENTRQDFMQNYAVRCLMALQRHKKY